MLLSSVCLLALGCSGDAGPERSAASAGAGPSAAGSAGSGGSTGDQAGAAGARAGSDAPRSGAGGAANQAGRSGANGAGSGSAGRAGSNASGAGGNGADGAGRAGSAGSGGSNAPDPGACDMGFIDAGKCDPQIAFQNDEASGEGAMFDEVIPDAAAAMKAIACQVCTILYRDPSEVTRDPGTIRLRIYDFDGVANAGGDTINFSSRHIANYDDPEDARFEFLGVLIHEATHLYQFDGGGGALVEGMADFVRIRAGHHRMNRRNPGGAWTDPYTTSGFFFSWLAGPGGLQTDGRPQADPDIGWAINQEMAGGDFSEAVFMQRLGEDVDTLWAEYQDAL